MAKTRRKMTAKQIKHFGTKRQKAALRAKRSAPKHRARTKTNPPRKRAVAKRAAPRKRAKKSTAKRRNPTPMIISWAAGNPAKRSTKVAKSKMKKRYATAKRSNAGRRPAKKVIRHRRRSNPASLGKPMDWLKGGAGVIVGVVGTRGIPQLLLGTSNTSYTGYAANVAAAIGLGWLTSILFKGDSVLVAAVMAGGFGSFLSRVITDKTPFGPQMAAAGLGDAGFGLYQKSNFPYPYTVQGARGPASSMFIPGDGGYQAVPMLSNAGSDSTRPC